MCNVKSYHESVIMRGAFSYKPEIGYEGRMEKPFRFISSRAFNA
jgi:hypothetical protein